MDGIAVFFAGCVLLGIALGEIDYRIIASRSAQRRREAEFLRRFRIEIEA